MDEGCEDAARGRRPQDPGGPPPGEEQGGQNIGSSGAGAAAPMIATAISNANLFSVITQASERVGNLFGRVQTEASKNEAIIEAIADGVLVIDQEQNIQLANPAISRILGVSRNQLADQKLSSILSIPGSDVDQIIIQQLYNIIIEQKDRLPDSEEASYASRIEVGEKALNLILTPVTFNMDHISQPSTLAVVRDISREAEIDRMKNEFISTVSLTA